MTTELLLAMLVRHVDVQHYRLTDWGWAKAEPMRRLGWTAADVLDVVV